ncbi:MAG: hypothetical protein IJ545_06465 [Alphaproteobacteria bacterium]|nr:hypothetical protein [Alphaproteobacteria bacterium]
MPAKTIQKVWLLTVILAVAAGFLLYRADVLRQKSIRGNLMFTSAEHLQNIKKMEFMLPNHQLTVYQDEKIWRLLEADNYYVDLKFLQRLQQEISSGKIGREVMPETGKLIWSTVKLYDASGNKTDEIQIANATELGEHYIRYPHDEKIYSSNWQINLPDETTAWTRQPLLDFLGIDISAFEKNGTRIFRRDEGTIFTNEKTKQLYRQYDYMKVFEALTNLWYEQVTSVQNFDEGKYPFQQKMRLETFDGLIMEIVIYSDYQEYWAKILLSSARLSKADAEVYVKDNEFLYRDWWFKLPLAAGRTLFLFNFNI